MQAFEEWQKRRARKTIGYLNNSSAYEAGEEKGWKAALEWLLEKGHRNYGMEWEDISDVIREELSGEQSNDQSDDSS